ncbi:PTS cellobiose transporter subunit IIC [Domibacillus indicus]|uniref:PTS cellobiose transporter subunit IIC n=1 Tax=Domibacillus indicus TaxID=1437523 RepID=UPI00061823CE|nr:PTS cellobiose transporter subunit IIC [Domibacillus indicus]
MNKLTQFLEAKVMPVAGRIAGQRHLQALRDGLIATMPLMIIGSLFLIIGFLPINGYPEMMASIFGDGWLDKLLYPVGATFDIMALVAAFAIAYRLAEKYHVDPLSAGIISLVAFLLATPYQVPFTPEGAEEAIMVGGAIPAALTGSKGLFIAMILAMVSTEIYRIIIQKNIVIRMPDGVPPAVSKSFVALIPGFAVVLTIWLLRLLVENTSFESLHNVVTQLLQEPLSALGGTLIGTILALILVQMLWSTGLHGQTIVGGVMGPIWLGAMDANRIAFQAGEEVPNIVTQQFIDIFVLIGGSGATLALVLAMLFTAKSKQMKQLGRLGIAPGLFNINEPIIFGMPIVMNPIMIIPFILVPIVVTTISFLSMQAGLIAKPVGISLPWTTPPIFGGYLATGGHFSGAILQLVNLAVAFFIYVPFFKMWDKQKVIEEGGMETSGTLDKKAL